jgi:amino acid transporter
VVILLIAFIRRAGGSSIATPHAPESIDLASAAIVAMWNYMGWDNASTIAGEVERPERSYPLGMMITIALVFATYALPVAAAWTAGLDPTDWDTGSWVTAGQSIGGAGLGFMVVGGGMICGLGMLNALVLSYSRVPFALAEDGLLPAIFRRRSAKTGAPWFSILACSAAWALCLGIGFERLAMLDVALYGSSLLLEFAALIALRIREPDLPRPFRVPGGLVGATLIGIGPLAMLGLALSKGAGETIGPVSALVFGAGLIALGPLIYVVQKRLRARVGPAVTL